MPPSSPSLQAARQRIGGKLRELRLAAELSGRAFASAADCQVSTITQIYGGTNQIQRMVMARQGPAVAQGVKLGR